MIDRALRVVGVVVVASLGWSGCSNDAELPSAYHRDLLGQPTAVESVQGSGVLTVSWQLASAADVAGFVVEVVDPTGAAHTRPVTDPTARTTDIDDLSLTEGELYLVRVWAVDALDSSAFSGQPSAVDSLVAE